ncbi:hypothetical protein LLG95_17575, partial [bacterium]|nr:hypothetical protein [bacterium]
MPRMFVICCLILMMPAFAPADMPITTKVVVRRYENIEGNPEAYEGIQADMPVETMSIDPSKLAGSGLLVLTAADQTDAEFAKTLGGGFYSLPFKDGKVFPRQGPPTSQVTLTAFGMRFAPKAVQYTVQDALGNPIPGATVEPIAFKYARPAPMVQKPAGPLLGRFKTDDTGGIELPWPVGECDHYYFTVSHEQYGVACVAALSFRMPVRVGLVPAGSPARERALNGRVQMPDGSPAAGAVILVNDVRAPGSGPTATGGFCVIAGPDGRFSAYPWHMDRGQNMGELIPLGSTYFFRVIATSDARQPVVCFDRTNGPEVEIKLERGNKLRRFAFEDEHGLITDPQRLNAIAVTHEASDERSKTGYKWSEAVQDHWFLPGKYSAAVYSPTTMGMQTETFRPVTIDANTPDLVVFRSGAQTVFEGRVIDGATNRPMPGAIVYAVTSHLSQVTRKRLDNLTLEEWAAIHKLPPDPKQDDPALAPLKRIDDFAHVTRTGPDGRYRLAVAPGAPVRWIMAAEENFVGVRQNLQGKPQGTVTVDDIKIFPAATVTFRIVNKRERNLHLVPVWLVERAGLSSLASDYFFPKQARPNMQFEYF